jgi:hypothetical protein
LSAVLFYRRAADRDTIEGIAKDVANAIGPLDYRQLTPFSCTMDLKVPIKMSLDESMGLFCCQKAFRMLVFQVESNAILSIAREPSPRMSQHRSFLEDCDTDESLDFASYLQAYGHQITFVLEPIIGDISTQVTIPEKLELPRLEQYIADILNSKHPVVLFSRATRDLKAPYGLITETPKPIQGIPCYVFGAVLSHTSLEGLRAITVSVSSNGYDVTTVFRAVVREGDTYRMVCEKAFEHSLLPEEARPWIRCILQSFAPSKIADLDAAVLTYRHYCRVEVIPEDQRTIDDQHERLCFFIFHDGAPYRDGFLFKLIEDETTASLLTRLRVYCRIDDAERVDVLDSISNLLASTSVPYNVFKTPFQTVRLRRPQKHVLSVS